MLLQRIDLIVHMYLIAHIVLARMDIVIVIMEVMKATKAIKVIHHIQIHHHIQIQDIVLKGNVSYGPSASQVPTVKTPVGTTEKMFKVPDINDNIQIPKGTPVSEFVPTLAVPASSSGTNMNVDNLKTPSSTEKVE